MFANRLSKWFAKMLASFILGVSFVFLALLLMGQSYTPKVFAATNVSSNILTDTTWTVAGSPYNIMTGTVFVQNGAVLTIQPGVTVRFQDGSRLEVDDGQLIAIGTSVQPISFTSQNPSPSRGSWVSIQLNASLPSTIAHSIIEYGREAIRIDASSTPFYILSNTIRYAGDYDGNQATGGAIKGTQDDSFINYNQIYSSEIGIRLNEAGRDEIRGNIIYDIDEDCIAIGPGGVSGSNDNLITENRVYNCGAKGIRVDEVTIAGGNNVVANIITNTNEGAIYLNNQTGAVITNNLIYNIPLANGSGFVFEWGQPFAPTFPTLNSNAICVDGQYEVESTYAISPLPASGNWVGTNTPTSPPEYSANVNINPTIILTATPAATTLPADGSSTTQIVITMNDGSGRTVPVPARTLSLSTDFGTIDPSATLNANGVATATLTATSFPATATITITELCNYAINIQVAFQQADLGINKSTTVNQVVPGQTITYTIPYSNNSGIQATNVTITDALPTGVVWVSDDAPAQGFTRVQTSPDVIWTHPALGPNTSGVITLVGRVLSTAGCNQTLTNNVAISSDTSDSNPSNNTASDNSAQTICADVTITKTGPGGSVTPGDTITYTIVYSNIGDAPAQNVVITDVNPVSGTIDTLVSVLTLNPGERFTRLYPVPTNASICANAGASLTNTAFISTSTPESDYSNNTDTADAASGAPQINCYNLAITKTIAITWAVPGQTITYTIEYTNNSDYDAPGVIISDALPISTTYVGNSSVFSTAVNGDGSVVTWTVGLLPAHTGGSFVLTATISPAASAIAPTFITNTVYIASAGGEQDTNDNVDTAVLYIQNGVNLIVSKDDGFNPGDPLVQAGDLITFTIQVQNLGNEIATNVVLTETLPVNTLFVGPTGPSGWFQLGGGNIYTYAVGDLAFQQSRNISFVVQVDPGLPCAVSQITNTVAAGSSQGDLDPGDNIFVAAPTTVVCVPPTLSITKTTAVLWSVPGRTVTYTLQYFNSGPGTAGNAIITDALPISTTFANSTLPISSNVGGIVTWDLGDIPPNTGGSFDFSVTINPSLDCAVTQQIINNAYIWAVNLQSGSSSATSNVDVNLRCGVDLSVVKNDNIGTGDPITTSVAGGFITYTIQVRNGGSEAATNVVLTETLPAGSSFVGVVDANGWFAAGGGQYIYNVGTLTPTFSAEVEFIVQVDPGLSCAVTEIVNTVQTGSSETDIDPSNNISNEQTPVVCVPTSLVITKTVNTLFTMPGRAVTYTIDYLNVGPGTAGNAVITDALPISATYTGSSLPISGNSGGVITWTLGDLPPGASGSIVLTATVDSALDCNLTQTLTNTAYISADNTLPGSSSASSGVGIQVLCGVDLSVVKNDGVGTGDPIQIVQAGNLISYTIQVRNGGSEPATGVVLTETLPTYTAFVGPTGANGWFAAGGGQYTYNIGDLTPGQSAEVQFVVRVSTSLPCSILEVVNTVRAGGNESDVDLSNNVSNEQTPVECLPLVLTKTDGNLVCAIPGQQIDYRISITNNMAGAVTNQLLTEFPDLNTTFLGIPLQWSGAYPYTQTVNSIAAGGQFNTLFSVLVNTGIATTTNAITNVVTLSPAGLAYTLTTPINYTSPDLFVVKNDNIELLPKTAAQIAYIERKTGPLPQLEALKPKPGKIQAIYVQPGDVISYSIAWGNAALSVATGVVITETIPENTTFIGPNYWQSVGGRTYVYNVGSVGPGFPAIPNPLRLYVRVDDPFPAGVPGVTNTVQISSDALLECDISDNISIEYTAVGTPTTTTTGTVYLPIVITPAPPPPTATLVWVNQDSDLVAEEDGGTLTSFVPDGRNDGRFLLTVNTGETNLSRTINRMVMTTTQTGGVVWDTPPLNSIFVLGIFQGATRLNNIDGSIFRALTTQDNYDLYLSDDAPFSRFVCDPPLYQYTVGVYFDDGTSAVAGATIPDCTPPPPAPPLAWVSDVAADPTTNQIFIASPREDAVHVIDGSVDQYVQPIGVGHGPTGLAVLTSTVPSKVAVAHAYALNDWNPGAWYINTQNLTSNSQPDLGGYVGAAPTKVTANAQTNRFFYSNYFDRMPIVDGVFQNRIAWVFKKNFQASYGIESNQTSNLVYMAAIDTGELIIFDETQAEADPNNYGACHNAPPDDDNNGDADPRIMRQVAVNPATGHIFVTSPPDPNPDNGQFESRVYVLDEGTMLANTTPPGSRPSDATCLWNFLKTGEPRPPFKWAPNALPGKGWIASIPLSGASSPGPDLTSPGAGVEGATVNPRTGKVYITDSYANKVFVLQDYANGSGNAPEVIKTINSGFDNPQGVDVNIETNRIYVANARSDAAPYGTVTVIDGNTDTVLYIVPLSSDGTIVFP